jgi:hypothetical protein
MKHLTIALVLLSSLTLTTLIARADQPQTDPQDPPKAPPYGTSAPACNNNGQDISKDSAAILAAIQGSAFCWQAVQLAENCGGGDALDADLVKAATPVCAKEFEAHKPTVQDRALLANLKAACDGKWKAKEGGQYVSGNAYCQLKALQWMANLTAEN